MENVRERKEEHGRGRAEPQRREHVCRCRYVSVCGRKSNTSYWLLRNPLFGFIIPKIKYVILPHPALPHTPPHT